MFCCKFGIREKVCVMKDHGVKLVRSTPLHSAKSMALSAMVVECE